MHQHLHIQNTRLHSFSFIIDENRPTIVFLHDSLGCVTLWRSFPQQLGEMTQCNVLVYDRQGYGQSDPFTTSSRTNDYMEQEADTLMLLLETCALTNVILFGHSDGGSIALIAAGKYPDRIKGVITEGAHIFVEEITLNGIREAVKLYQHTDLKKKLEKYHGDKTEAVFHMWADTWLSNAFRSWDITDFLPGIKCPVLVIQGESDEYGTIAQVEGIAQQVSGEASVYMIPGIGHTPHKEAAQPVLDRAAVFIQSLY
ncbi:pimeloyl-ACP methyl ester carboxylesterase [Chitinophaga dinghuensis]|uniref:Pimeloyl-ACP methyl ester carboxylesterase n=1 Tax=Chitinophaga dinghuensis TaxID=1539050 RepID=A0A327WD69_9BACT|nr:alpha/beta hydrolase [Chitinophaga dinghuensis]RAJ88078.1 pimeloyl-ACP methyl ester carboxylesterase [Chitinophaga dinghuensis]